MLASYLRDPNAGQYHRKFLQSRNWNCLVITALVYKRRRRKIDVSARQKASMICTAAFRFGGLSKSDCTPLGGASAGLSRPGSDIVGRQNG